MSNHAYEGNETLEIMQSLPVDESVEKIDALWRQIMVYKAFAEGDLSEAKAKRAQAEALREKTEQDSAEATLRMCAGIKKEAEDKIREAESLRSEAARVLGQAETERQNARTATQEAEAKRERIVAEAKRKAQDILDKSRMAAQQEGTELRRQALERVP